MHELQGTHLVHSPAKWCCWDHNVGHTLHVEAELQALYNILFKILYESYASCANVGTTFKVVKAAMVIHLIMQN